MKEKEKGLACLGCLRGEVPRFSFISCRWVNTHGTKMAGGDGEADGEGCESFDIVASLVTHPEHRQDQHEGDNYLHSEGLANVHAASKCSHSQGALLLIRRQTL